MLDSVVKEGAAGSSRLLLMRGDCSGVSDLVLLPSLLLRLRLMLPGTLGTSGTLGTGSGAARSVSFPIFPSGSVFFSGSFGTFCIDGIWPFGIK